MILTEDNFNLYAAKNYNNELCVSTEEFEEDLKRFFLCKKQAKKMLAGRSENIRLLCNHIICITNMFEVQAVKEMFKFICDDKEITVIKAILNYLNFLRKDEWLEVRDSLEVYVLLKEMDR